MLDKKPSRKIPKNYRNITGKFSSNKSSNLISFESKLERDFLYLFEFEANIINILEQPITITYKKNEKQYRYTPDFYLKTKENQKDIIVEVKYYEELKKIFVESKEKYKAMSKYCNIHNIDFKILTDKCIFIKNEDYKFNLHFLLNFNEINNTHLKYIKNHFKPYVSIQSILKNYSSNKFEQMSLINTIWTLIRKQILIVKLEERLSVYSRLVALKIDELEKEEI